MASGEPQLQFLGPIVLQALLQDLDDLRAVPAVDEDHEAKAESPLVLGVQLLQLGRLIRALLVPREGGHALWPLPDSGVRVQRGHLLLFAELSEKPSSRRDHVLVRAGLGQPASERRVCLEEPAGFRGRLRSHGRRKNQRVRRGGGRGSGAGRRA